MPPGVSARLRIVRRVAAMLAALLLALVGHGLWRAVRARSPWPRWLLGRIARIAGARVRVIGSPRTRDALMLANHQSWLDILAIAGASGSAFVAKGELASVPLVGWLCTLNHTVFVSRENRLGVAEQVARLRDALATDHPVTVFPEGTTSDGTTLLPFKAALLAALDPPPPGLIVQPVQLDYGAAARPLLWVGDEPGLANVRRVLAHPGGIDLCIRFLDPFDPAGMHRKAIAAEAHRRIADAMARVQ